MFAEDEEEDDDESKKRTTSFFETAFNGMYPDEEHNVKFVKSGASNLFRAMCSEGCEVVF